MRDAVMYGCLWQYIGKEHMEDMIDDQLPISDEEWSEFVEICQDAFANQVSVLALEYWNERHKLALEFSKVEGEE